jgi:hypothetical protein
MSCVPDVLEFCIKIGYHTLAIKETVLEVVLLPLPTPTLFNNNSPLTKNLISLSHPIKNVYVSVYNGLIYPIISRLKLSVRRPLL